MKLSAFLLLSLSVANVFSSPEDDLRTGNQQLSAKLYKEILKTKPNDNFVYSPFPVQTILATLASAGNNDQSTTVKEIRDVLGLPQNKADTESAFQSILSEMEKSSDDDFKLFDASKMYIKQGYTVQEWYKQTAQRIYHTEIETINFADSYNTVNSINSWVSKKTNNKINNYIDQSDINGGTTNVLINALFVMGKWVIPFDKDKNVLAKFYGLHQTTTNVDMMTNTDSYDYAEDTNAKFLKMELFRNGGGAEMIFILPHKRDGLEQLESNVEQLIQKQSYYNAKVDVQLPKFTINTDLKMKPMLQNLGIRKLFTFGLELIGLKSPYHPYMQVTDVMQKSILEVAEWGVTAAAAVEAKVLVDATPIERHKEFIADHPFLFYIVVDDIVMFAGRVVKP